MFKADNTRLFADDTNLTATGKPVEEVERAMSGDLEYVKKWLLAPTTVYSPSYCPN